MSEQVRRSPETAPVVPAVTVERPNRAEQGSAEQASRVERAQAAVASEVSHTERAHLPAEPIDDRPQLVDKAVKMFRMRRNLSYVQNQLKPAEKSFSRIIHQPLVRRVSETAGKTATRPSGMLGGGLFAFIGSSLYLYLAHHIGFTYNYLVFLLFFGGGFMGGVALEYAAYGLRCLRR